MVGEAPPDRVVVGEWKIVMKVATTDEHHEKSAHSQKLHGPRFSFQATSSR